MNWIIESEKKPSGPRDVLMYFADRDVFCIGWYDAEEDDWFIWRGMDDSTLMDGAPEYWAELEVPGVKVSSTSESNYSPVDRA